MSNIECPISKKKPSGYWELDIQYSTFYWLLSQYPIIAKGVRRRHSFGAFGRIANTECRKEEILFAPGWLFI
jgi:hypothetical protein